MVRDRFNVAEETLDPVYFGLRDAQKFAALYRPTDIEDRIRGGYRLSLSLHGRDWRRYMRLSLLCIFVLALF